MYHVPFVCPECDHSAEAPISGISAGDAGIWVCDACGRAYQIEIEFCKVTIPRFETIGVCRPGCNAALWRN